MYHSDMKPVENHRARRQCDLVLDHDSVSRLHANIEVTEKAISPCRIQHSSNGTFLHRNGRWIRSLKVILGTQDRIRFRRS